MLPQAQYWRRRWRTTTPGRPTSRTACRWGFPRPAWRFWGSTVPGRRWRPRGHTCGTSSSHEGEPEGEPDVVAGGCGWRLRFGVTARGCTVRAARPRFQALDRVIESGHDPAFERIHQPARHQAAEP